MNRERQAISQEDVWKDTVKVEHVCEQVRNHR